MFWLAESLKGVPYDVFDVHQGIITLDLGVYLHEYNSAANQNLLFTMERFTEFLDSPYFRMGLAGPLGMKGNIVFSTSLHGIALGQNSMKPDYDCCVGDDALSFVFSHMFALFVRYVNLLGSINQDKFSIVRSISSDPGRTTAFKFLKRPLDLSGLGVPTLGVLNFFPDVASVLFPDGDGFHTLEPGSTWIIRCRTFVTQVAKFSTLLAEHGFLIESWEVGGQDLYEDTDYLISCFTLVYNTLGLPVGGAKPGLVILNPEEDIWEVLDVWVPPLTPELFLEGWVSACYWRFQGEDIEVPWVASRKPPPEEAYVGMTFYATGDFKELALLQALGELKSELLKRTVRFDEYYMKYLKGLLDRPHKEYEVFLYKYTVVEVNPSWNDLFRIYYSNDIDGHNILDNMTTVSSVFS
jgi:hypothetical protein